MADKEFTYDDVAEHNTKNDLLVVIHDKVFDVASFVDEHPGGEEVLLDMGGQDATEAFEDVGHSDEAREILDKLIVGKLKRKEGDPKQSTSSTTSAGEANASSGFNVVYISLLLLGVVSAAAVYQFMKGQ